MRGLARTSKGDSGPPHCHLSPPGAQPHNSRHAPTYSSYLRCHCAEGHCLHTTVPRSGSATSARLYFRLEGGRKQPIAARSDLASPASGFRRVSSGRGNSLAPQSAVWPSNPVPQAMYRRFHVIRCLPSAAPLCALHWVFPMTPHHLFQAGSLPPPLMPTAYSRLRSPVPRVTDPGSPQDSSSHQQVWVEKFPSEDAVPIPRASPFSIA